MRRAEHPAAERILLHISDTHLRAAGPMLFGDVDGAAYLASALRGIEESGIAPDAVIFTGDLVDLGEGEAYGILRSLVEPFAERLGTRVLWVVGNHDDRPAFRGRLLGETPADPYAPYDRVDEIDGLRVITLDTSVPGHHHGELSDDQLAWLGDVLSSPAPLGSILAMHHPPVPSVLPLASSVELRDQHRLASIVRGSDVRAILAGHLHYSSHGTFAGVPVSVASATCYTMNVARPAEDVNGMDAAQAFQLVHVYPDTITHTVVPVVEAPTGDFFTREWAERMASLTPEQRLEVFSRKPGR